MPRSPAEIIQDGARLLRNVVDLVRDRGPAPTRHLGGTPGLVPNAPDMRADRGEGQEL